MRARAPGAAARTVVDVPEGRRRLDAAHRGGCAPTSTRCSTRAAARTSPRSRRSSRATTPRLISSSATACCSACAPAASAASAAALAAAAARRRRRRAEGAGRRALCAAHDDEPSGVSSSSPPRRVEPTTLPLATADLIFKAAYASTPNALCPAPATPPAPTGSRPARRRPPPPGRCSLVGAVCQRALPPRVRAAALGRRGQSRRRLRVPIILEIHTSSHPGQGRGRRVMLSARRSTRGDVVRARAGGSRGIQTPGANDDVKITTNDAGASRPFNPG